MFRVSFLFLLGIVNIFSLGAAGAIESEVIRISTPHQGKNLLDIRERIQNAYTDIGYQTEIITMPAKRALHEAMHNPNIDAELMRASEAQSALTDYIKIPVPVLIMTVNGYSYAQLPTGLTWDTVHKYRIVTVRGVVAIETKFKQLNIEYVTVRTAKQALEMIQANRADIAILPKAFVDRAINANKQLAQPITNDILQQTAIYHYIHKRHKAIIPALEASLSNHFDISN
jgi:hypothetical protein